METPNRKWNVMVYLAGDNNLSEEMVHDLQEMQRAGAPADFKKKVRVVAQFDPRGTGPQRFDFTRNNSRNNPEKSRAQTTAPLGDLKHSIDSQFTPESAFDHIKNLIQNKMEVIQNRKPNDAIPAQVLPTFLEGCARTRTRSSTDVDQEAPEKVFKKDAFE